jgi:hypothetical protein
MKSIKTVLVILVSSVFIMAYSENSTPVKKEVKVTIEPSVQKSNTSGNREIVPSKGNWSKIKDLFM